MPRHEHLDHAAIGKTFLQCPLIGPLAGVIDPQVIFFAKASLGPIQRVVEVREIQNKPTEIALGLVCGRPQLNVKAGRAGPWDGDTVIARCAAAEPRDPRFLSFADP